MFVSNLKAIQRLLEMFLSTFIFIAILKIIQYYFIYRVDVVCSSTLCIVKNFCKRVFSSIIINSESIYMYIRHPTCGLIHEITWKIIRLFNSSFFLIRVENNIIIRVARCTVGMCNII